MQNAMSMPGDRDAQRMLRGEEPLSRGRALRPPDSLPGRRAPAPPRRSGSMPMPSDMEPKADPGIGAPSVPAVAVFSAAYVFHASNCALVMSVKAAVAWQRQMHACAYLHVKAYLDLWRADRILGLALSVFRTDAVLLHLRDKDEVFAKTANQTAFKPGTCAAICRLLEPSPIDFSVVQDLTADPR